jgi:hypothetical protein
MTVMCLLKLHEWVQEQEVCENGNTFRINSSVMEGGGSCQPGGYPIQNKDYFIYIYITTIGLTPGGSSTAHIYTQTMHRIQRTEQT